MELQQERTRAVASQGRQFIGGEWVDAADGRTFESLDPFTGDVVEDVAAGGARTPRVPWRPRTLRSRRGRARPAVRQGIFLKAADLLEARHDEVVSLLARETGCTFGFGMFQLHFVPGLPGRPPSPTPRSAR